MDVPSICNHDLTMEITYQLGAGYYEAESGLSYAELQYNQENGGISCEVTW